MGSTGERCFGFRFYGVNAYEGVGSMVWVKGGCLGDTEVWVHIFLLATDACLRGWASHDSIWGGQGLLLF